MIRILSLCAGLCGAVTFSQYPEFAQQYTQRLAGQVDALGVVVADFDRSALEAGLTRTQAIGQLEGTAFLDARQSDMQETFARHTTLTASLVRLREATALERVSLVNQLKDTQTLKNTWADFQPAVPMTTAGAVTGGIGYFAGWSIMALVLNLLRLLFTKRSPARSLSQPRRDPPITRTTAQSFQTPRLMGETRP